MSDEITVEILGDGTLKITTPDVVSPPNHRSADDLLNLIRKLAGGETTRTKRTDHKHHHHAHEHGHQHEHHHH